MASSSASSRIERSMAGFVLSSLADRLLPLYYLMVGFFGFGAVSGKDPMSCLLTSESVQEISSASLTSHHGHDNASPIKSRNNGRAAIVLLHNIIIKIINREHDSFFSFHSTSASCQQHFLPFQHPPLRSAAPFINHARLQL